jgi:hypothetical protein
LQPCWEFCFILKIHGTGLKVFSVKRPQNLKTTRMNPISKQHPASFRDPSGYIYKTDDTLFRFVSVVYKEQYEHLQKSGLLQLLVQQGLLLPFEEIDKNHTNQPNWFRTLQPQYIPFFTYPWEWSFDQLKDAALTTLSICKKALDKGMILKDATPLNIQFINGKPVLIDHLSFEIYEQGTAWIAYRQFCECFLNPLLLACYCGLETHRTALAYADGIAVSTAAALLPLKTKFHPEILLHVHLHAGMSKSKFGSKKEGKQNMSAKNIKQILESLESCIQKLSPYRYQSAWSNYYSETILSTDYFESKKQLVKEHLRVLDYHSVLDAGTNTGEFAMLCKPNSFVTAIDADSNCINDLYLQLKSKKLSNIQPLVIDLMHPSPATGWENGEHTSFIKRMKFDLCLVLALIHHLCISKNLSFEQLASFLASHFKILLIEFVPKTDPKVAEMLQNRKDIFDGYTQEHFENIFKDYFELKDKKIIQGSERTLYLLEKKA